VLEVRVRPPDLKLPPRPYPPGSFAALAAIRSASFAESLTGATQVPARYMAYKATTAISANRANGRTADEGIESCSPYWIMDRGSSRSGRRLGAPNRPRPHAAGGRVGSLASRPFLGFRVRIQPQTSNAIIAAKKIPSATLSSMVLSVAHRHCCIRRSGAVTRSFDAVGKSPP
jgi:hypothetical protein